MPKTRPQQAATVEELGGKVFEVRMGLLESNMPFVAGLVRAAEENLVLAKTMLEDSEHLAPEEL